jgi:serine/threonine protein kinase
VSAEETLPDTEPAAPAPAFGSPGERYALGEELGRGGMGRVVAARDLVLEREVAIKQVLTDDADLIARFEREVRITAQLEHPSIVALHEAGRDSANLPYYVMRRIAGVALTERLANADGVRARLALVPSVAAVVDAAAFAHAKRIIHRDIKPANIMLGPFGEAYLIDWGIARRLDDPTDPINPDGGEARGAHARRSAVRHRRIHGARAGAR